MPLRLKDGLTMKDLENRFAEIERRIKGVLNENRSLKDRIGELEQELERVRSKAQELEHFHGKRLHIKEKIERVLSVLETAGGKK